MLAYFIIGFCVMVMFIEVERQAPYEPWRRYFPWICLAVGLFWPMALVVFLITTIMLLCEGRR